MENAVFEKNVALRKESVDRNCSLQSPEICLQVALRKESVDRNNIYIAAFVEAPRVALRKESVDRNNHFGAFFCTKYVALRKESVDRNGRLGAYPSGGSGRSPQGERG